MIHDDSNLVALTERNLIRQKLIQYKKQNGIGVVRLARAIKSANPHRVEIPIKTLQRFLAGEMRTEDRTVNFCRHFAESLVAFDSMAKLGESLVTFYGASGDTDYSGQYLTETDKHDFDKDSKALADISRDNGFWRITETVADTDNISIFDGVLASNGSAATVLLKDRHSGCSRNYVLTASPIDSELYGVGSTVLYTPDPDDILENQIPIEIRLKRIAGNVKGRVRAFDRRLERERISAKPAVFDELEVRFRTPTIRRAVFLRSAYNGHKKRMESCMRGGVPLDLADKMTGMTALHLAVGQDHLGIAEMLVEGGAPFVTDKQGRMPSTVAAECEVSEAMNDFIAEAEARAEGV
jgi:hypothetical protein